MKAIGKMEGFRIASNYTTGKVALLKAAACKAVRRPADRTAIDSERWNRTEAGRSCFRAPSPDGIMKPEMNFVSIQYSQTSRAPSLTAFFAVKGGKPPKLPSHSPRAAVPDPSRGVWRDGWETVEARNDERCIHSDRDYSPGGTND